MENLKGLKRPKWPLVASIILIMVAVIFAFFPNFFPWQKATAENSKQISVTFKSCDEWADGYHMKVHEYQARFIIKSPSEEQKEKLDSLGTGDAIVIGIFNNQLEDYETNRENNDVFYVVSFSIQDNQIYSLEDYNESLQKEKAQMKTITAIGTAFFAFSSLGLFLFYMLRKKRIKVVEV